MLRIKTAGQATLPARLISGMTTPTVGVIILSTAGESLYGQSPWHQQAAPDPTQAEIELACAEFQRTWTARERVTRKHFTIRLTPDDSFDSGFRPNPLWGPADGDQVKSGGSAILTSSETQLSEGNNAGRAAPRESKQLELDPSI